MVVWGLEVWPIFLLTSPLVVDTSLPALEFPASEIVLPHLDCLHLSLFIYIIYSGPVHSTPFCAWLPWWCVPTLVSTSTSCSVPRLWNSLPPLIRHHHNLQVTTQNPPVQTGLHSLTGHHAFYLFLWYCLVFIMFYFILKMFKILYFVRRPWVTWKAPGNKKYCYYY